MQIILAAALGPAPALPLWGSLKILNSCRKPHKYLGDHWICIAFPPQMPDTNIGGDRFYPDRESVAKTEPASNSKK
jgi:hypothetical protein